MTTVPLPGFEPTVPVVHSGATVSDCARYRYRLWRRWGDGPQLGFVMLNPSTADAAVDDPTIRRCMGFARREGCDGIEVVNLFAWRATDPTEIRDRARAGVDVVGPENRRHLAAMAANPKIGLTVAAWGSCTGMRRLTRPRIAEVLDLFDQLESFAAFTSRGDAPHPLYLRGDTPLRPYPRP